MDPTFIVVLVLGTLFLSSLVRSSLGFGDAMVAMPLLTLLIPLRMATPIVALLSTSMAIFILFQDRKEVDFGATWKLSLGAMIGVPLGALLLTQLDEWIVKAFLGALVLSFCVFRLTSPQLSELKGDGKAPIFGFFSGVFGGAYNTFGPPIVVYGVMRRWKAETYRVSVQGFYLPVCVVVLGCHAYNGLWNAEVFRYYLAAIPVVIIATLLGRKVNHALGHRGGFDRVVYFALIGIALVLLFTALQSSGYSPFPWDVQDGPTPE